MKKRLPPDTLTPLEREVLQRVADGELVKDIVTRGNAKGAAWTAREKLGAHNLAHAVALAMRKGLVR